MRTIFIALPTYNGSRSNTLPILDIRRSLAETQVLPPLDIVPHFEETSSSLLACGFNLLWASALNLRAKKNVTHFLLLHADVAPVDADWIRTLLDEMEKTQAQVLSVVLPVKDHRGLVSTALDDGSMMPRGFTLADIQAGPETFTHEKLLVNTGCLLVRFDEPWVEKICFTVNDSITRNEQGQWEVRAEPEDYHFSRQCHRLGVRVFATRKVRAVHTGTHQYPNWVPQQPA
jgi:GT2 family glycosyltransferase